MADLAGVLGRVPGLAGYLGARQLQQQEGAQELQQVGALAQLQTQMQNQQGQALNRQRQESARQALAALGPDATEDQRVNALLPHIGDPDKIAGILQNASLKKSQQEQTKQIALSRLAQQASQHMQDLQVRQQNARTAEERSHWERQAANVRLGFQRQAAEIQAGRFNYDTGMIAPSVTPYAAPTGPVAAPAVQPAPTPAPAPGPAPAASPAGFPRQGPNEGKDAQLKIIQGEIAVEEQLALDNKNNPQQAEVHRLNAEKLRSELSKLGPAPANNLDARDLRLAGSPQPQATPQPAPQPAPQSAPREIVMPPEIARRPKKAQDAWMSDQIRRQGDAEKVGREAVVRQVSKGLEESYTKLREAPQALANIEKAKALIPDAKAFQGSLGEQKLAAAKFFNNNLGMSINLTGVESAEELRSRIFFNIMDNLKKMDSQPSENQQRIMQEALGKLGTDPSALPRILDAFGDVIRDKVTAYDKQVEEAKSSGVNWPHRITVPQRTSTTSGAVREFATEAEAAAAGITPGTRVKIGGKTGTWR